MFDIELASGRDFAYWMSMDGNMDNTEVRHLICNKRCYIMKADGKNVGILRYGLFQDRVPFLYFICIAEEERGKGYGSQGVELWEAEMRREGYPCVITSTGEDETSQAFYTKLGYKNGGYMAEIPSLKRPREVFLIKEFMPKLKVVGR